MRCERTESVGASSSSTSRAIVIIALVTSICGCGDGRPSRVPVSGQVLVDGEPLKTGYIRFTPPHHRSSQGKLDQNGRFTLGCFEDNDGAVLGEHQVEIGASEMVDDHTRRWNAPRKYADPKTSGLTQEVKGPMDNLIIKLSWDGEKPFEEYVEGPNGGGPRKSDSGKY